MSNITSKLTLIACISENRVLGKDNKLVFDIKEDLKRFKTLTTGQVVIMGRKTFESIGRPLPKRLNVVISKHLKPENLSEEVIWLDSPELIFEQNFGDKEVYIIGGQSLYEYFLPLASKLELTEVNSEVDGDTFFPQIDENIWQEDFISEIFKDGQLEYSFKTYKKPIHFK
jgi:dihydrofolate reductase